MKTRDSSIKSVLVVEDEPAISQVCQRVLTGEGFAVDTAVNGKVAQNMIAKKRYDLCLIDIRTPAMDGKELYHWLQEAYPKMIEGVIFTTGDTMGGDIERFLERRPDHFCPNHLLPKSLRRH